MVLIPSEHFSYLILNRTESKCYEVGNRNSNVLDSGQCNASSWQLFLICSLMTRCGSMFFNFQKCEVGESVVHMHIYIGLAYTDII